MVGRKLFKTKLCDLYQKGHCPRQSCSFAHGAAEIRRFSGSFNGRRNYRSGDLRDKLERRRSPLRRYSPGRDTRGRQVSRGYSPSNSGRTRSDRKRRKREHFDGQSDRSGSVKVSLHSEDRIGDRKLVSSGCRSIVGEQLRKSRSEINALNNHKSKLQIYLEERVQEADCLTSRIQELEMQLFQEREESKRITSKIKTFVLALKRNSRLQDELKRSHDQLQKLGDQLRSDASKLGATEDDANISILSDGETTANLMKGGGVMETIRIEKHSRWSGQQAQFDKNEEADPGDSGSDGRRALLNGTKSKRKKIALTNVASAEKLKGYEPGFGLPPTSMAAHAIDEVTETAEVGEDLEVVETAPTRSDGGTDGIVGMPFSLPPPSPLLRNSYPQYRGEEDNVDVDAVGEEIADVDVD